MLTIRFTVQAGPHSSGSTVCKMMCVHEMTLHQLSYHCTNDPCMESQTFMLSLAKLLLQISLQEVYVQNVNCQIWKNIYHLHYLQCKRYPRGGACIGLQSSKQESEIGQPKLETLLQTIVFGFAHWKCTVDLYSRLVQLNVTLPGCIMKYVG